MKAFNRKLSVALVAFIALLCLLMISFVSPSASAAASAAACKPAFDDAHNDNILQPGTKVSLLWQPNCPANVNYAGIKYQWNIDGKPVPGETHMDYTVKASDVNKQLSETITFASYLVTNGATAPGPVSFTSPKYWITDKQDGYEMYRLYNPNSGEHFYTKNYKEAKQLDAIGWSFEGPAWYAPVKSGTPVYRLYNPNAGDHFYTTNLNEKNSLVKVGWNYEGIGWYSNEMLGAREVLYRQYNPNAVAGSHNYTTNIKENNALVKAGWKAEGTAWYGIPYDTFWYLNLKNTKWLK
jgi:hypothetical protein